MKDIRRGLDLLGEKDKNKAIEEVIRYFQMERDEEIGIIAATEILEHFTFLIGDGIYNKAIDDTRELFKKLLEGIDFEIDLLKKQ